MTTSDDLLGAYVVATNERGGRWRGLCVTFTLDGKAVLVCDAVNIGYGWVELKQEKHLFDPERLEVVDAAES